MDYRQILAEECQRHHLDASHFISGALSYLEMLEEDGDRLGLTGLKDPADRMRELVLDPLEACSRLTAGAKVVDIGSGGGCPGISLALARPDTSWTLVESNRRKAGFLTRAIETLELSACVQAERSEILAHLKPHRESCDHATAKAVAGMSALLELTLPWIKVGGTLLAFKGPALEGELQAARRALQVLGGVVEEIVPYQLGERSYQLCIVRKEKPTGPQYPRRPGMPAHSPL